MYKRKGERSWRKLELDLKEGKKKRGKIGGGAGNPVGNGGGRVTTKETR